MTMMMRVWQKRTRGQRQTPFSAFFHSVFLSFAVLCYHHILAVYSAVLSLSGALHLMTTTTIKKNKKKPGSTIVLYHHHHNNNNTVRCVQSLTPCASTDKTTTLFLTMQCASALLAAAAAVDLSNGWKRSKMRIDHTHQPSSSECRFCCIKNRFFV